MMPAPARQIYAMMPVTATAVPLLKQLLVRSKLLRCGATAVFVPSGVYCARAVTSSYHTSHSQSQSQGRNHGLNPDPDAANR
jgi:hypothetical protein